MGLGSVGKLVLYQLDLLSRLDIADIARGMRAVDPSNVSVNKQDAPSVDIRPSIDVDANPIQHAKSCDILTTF